MHVPDQASPASIYHFSFHLYHVFKEPIPFRIQCKILHHDPTVHAQSPLDCSSLSIDSHANVSVRQNSKRNHSYTFYRSLSVLVTRQIPSIDSQYGAFYGQSNEPADRTQHALSRLELAMSVASVQSIGCIRLLPVVYASLCRGWW